MDNLFIEGAKYFNGIWDKLRACELDICDRLIERRIKDEKWFLQPRHSFSVSTYVIDRARTVNTNLPTAFKNGVQGHITSQTGGQIRLLNHAIANQIVDIAKKS